MSIITARQFCDHGADILCAALVRPGTRLESNIKRQWQVESGVRIWGIFERDRALGICQLRFGDGTWLELDSADLDALIVLPSIDWTVLAEVWL